MRPIALGCAEAQASVTMRPELATMTERVAALRERSAAPAAAEAVLDEIEDALAEGYAQALAGDAWSMRSEQRLHDLISSVDPVRGGDLRTLAGDHTRFQHDLIELRRELAALRRERDRLRATTQASA